MKKVLVLGSAQVTVAAGQERIVRITLGAAGRASHRLQTKLTARTPRNGAVIASKTVTFRARPRAKKR